MSNMLPTDYQAFIHTSRYARWVEEENRRETWSETVSRYITNIVEPISTNISITKGLEQAILNLDVMPSMRSMMTAGAAADRDNTCMYNCSYLPVDDVKSFDEAMFILLCGTGVGFSVERQYINELPEIPKWNVSKVRPAGARLKTFGGRASGPAPLIDLFNFTIGVFKIAQGRKLNSIECHDLMCKVGEVVVVGGVRRSAMISLSNLTDDRMRHAKDGKFWELNGQRQLANNSVCYTEKPDETAFMEEWLSLIRSNNGERGIFNRQASKVQAAKNDRRDPNYDFGTNPCSEIILRPYQFCNLTEVVVRATDTLETLGEKVRYATILGTIQSTYTKFPYLRKIWQNNTEEERLLGVSLTGIMDNPLMTSVNKGLDKTLEHLKNIAITTNANWAERLGIPVSTAITCVKPSGTVSQLVDSASGIHARHSPYYIRTVRADNNDPLTQFMKDQGIPFELCVSKPETTTVFSFPVQAPNKAVTRNDITAIDQLNMWLIYQRHWTEHKPSVTISVRKGEWIPVLNFVHQNFDEVSGVSFLPHDDHIYQQAPYQDCNKNDYKILKSIMPKKIDWSKLSDFESEDTTKSSQTFACTGEVCEIVDISA